MGQWRRWLVVVSACLMVGGFSQATAVAATGACQVADAAWRQAQSALARAVRDADKAAVAYSRCMEKGVGCAPLKAQYDAAQVNRQQAQTAAKAAKTKRDAACK